jgi:nucleoid DNA-binding protein
MNERLSLQDLIDLLAKKQEITKKDAEAFLREFIAVVSENIESYEPVKIKDFGTFRPVKVNARKSVDINTGEAIEIAAHYKLSFIPDKSLKEAVNRPFAHFGSVVLEEGVSFDNVEEEEVPEGIEEEEDASVDEDVKEQIVITPIDISRETEDKPVDRPHPEIVEDSDIKRTGEEIILPEEVINEAAEEEVVEDISTPDSDPEVARHEIENEISRPPADIPDEWHELEKYRRAAKRRRRLISLGFFIFLIVAGFLIGGLYFQEIAKYLTDGPADNNKTAVVDDKPDVKHPETGIVPADTLPATREQDSVAASINGEPPQPETNDAAGQPAVNTSPAPDANAPLDTVTIGFGSTLRNIALKYYGHKSFCVYIYEENIDKIKNINNIPLGTELVIPSAAKYGINAQDKGSVERAKDKESRLYREMGL